MTEVRKLTKKYGANTAVSSLSFTVEDGMIYGLLGPNGAGKTTTMNMITGCLSPSGGAVLIDGIDISEDPIRAKKLIGYLPETPPLYPDMTPFEYLMFVARAKGVPSSEIYTQVGQVMEETDIFEMRDRLIKNLSKGYRQRVGIAQALLGDPHLVVLDEPTVGLDPKQLIEIRKLIAKLGKTRTVILSSHILSEVTEICDRVMIISGGKLVACDTLDNIRKDNSPENTIELTVRASTEQITAVLEKDADITDFTVSDKDGSESVLDITLYINTDADINEKLECLAKALSDSGIAVRKLTRSEPSLEEIFLSLTDSSYGYEAEDEDASLPDDDGYDSQDGDGFEEDDDDEEDGEDSDYSPLFTERRDIDEDALERKADIARQKDDSYDYDYEYNGEENDGEKEDK